ncbi:hypothetical protein DEM27_10590 [Metarhizobium album]|uniref:Uncharacterized protein n=1 Tax=Metarhizobium album TaxID=2182425 RepID=A0A2U2DU37_9HYPH|nr:hypothetical protein [Rhizobium album]PWE56801.1 hypothetical protein DEM27_10590 [Rhizobium album]
MTCNLRHHNECGCAGQCEADQYGHLLHAKSVSHLIMQAILFISLVAMLATVLGSAFVRTDRQLEIQARV